MNFSRIKKSQKNLKYFYLTILIIFCLALTSCGPGSTVNTENAGNMENNTGVNSENTTISDQNGTEIQQEPLTDSKASAAAPAATTDPNHIVNPLTGLTNMDKSNAGKRPVAVMISNIKQATPQSGINDVDMYYEIPAEGGISRIMGIFADVNKIPSVLGPIRSARDYYVSIADGYNCVFVHFGTSKTADTAIADYNVNDLELMNLDSAWWEDSARKAKYGAEHSKMTSGDRLKKAISNKKYNMNTGINGGNVFDFYQENNFTAAGATLCNTISAKLSSAYAADFKYDQGTKLYGKNQFGAPFVDDKGKQVKVTNVIVIYTNITVLNDSAGHLAVDLSSGKGYYASGGKCKEIKWSKGNFTNPIKYYNTDGTDLTVNAGKTYVCVVSDAKNVSIS